MNLNTFAFFHGFSGSDSDKEDQNVVIVKEGGVVTLKQVKKKAIAKTKHKDEETLKPIGRVIYRYIYDLSMEKIFPIGNK